MIARAYCRGFAHRFLRENGYGAAAPVLAQEGAGALASAAPASPYGSPYGLLFDLSSVEEHLRGLAPAAAAAVNAAGAPRFLVQWARDDLDGALAAARGDAPTPPPPRWAVDAARAARPAGREPAYAWEWGGKLIAKHLVLREADGWLGGELAGLASATAADAARTAALWHEPAAALRKQLGDAEAGAAALRMQVADAEAAAAALRKQVADEEANAEALRTQMADEEHGRALALGAFAALGAQAEPET